VSSLRPLFPDQRVVGVAVTVLGTAIEQCSWDEGVARIDSYLRLFDTLQPDDVLVSVNGDSHVGHFGELTGNTAQLRGCAGVILDGNLRDIEGLREIGLQVFYRDLSPLNAIGRWEMAAAQVPVRIGDVDVHPGDLVFAEFDGVLVIPADEAEGVLLAAEAVVSGEELVRADLRAGVSPADGLAKHGYI
jgi:regulator of RNase E activity RraA